MAIPITQRAKSPAKNTLIDAASRMYDGAGKPPPPVIKLEKKEDKDEGQDITKTTEDTVVDGSATTTT